MASSTLVVSRQGIKIFYVWPLHSFVEFREIRIRWNLQRDIRSSRLDTTSRLRKRSPVIIRSIRSWIGRKSPFACVVMIVNLQSVFAVLRSSQQSHSPARQTQTVKVA
jgi:hypothetical protein